MLNVKYCNCIFLYITWSNYLEYTAKERRSSFISCSSSYFTSLFIYYRSYFLSFFTYFYKRTKLHMFCITCNVWWQNVDKQEIMLYAHHEVIYNCCLCWCMQGVWNYIYCILHNIYLNYKIMQFSWLTKITHRPCSSTIQFINPREWGPWNLTDLSALSEISPWNRNS